MSKLLTVLWICIILTMSRCSTPHMRDGSILNVAYAAADANPPTGREKSLGPVEAEFCGTDIGSLKIIGFADELIKRALIKAQGTLLKNVTFRAKVTRSAVPALFETEQSIRNCWTLTATAFR